jgi:hypothetical protein
MFTGRFTVNSAQLLASDNDPCFNDSGYTVVTGWDYLPDLILPEIFRKVYFPASSFAQ